MKTKKLTAFLLTLTLLVSLCSGTVYAKSDVGCEAIPEKHDQIAASPEISSPKANSKAIIVIPGILGSELKDTETNQTAWVGVSVLRLKLGENGESLFPIEVKPSNYGTNNTYKELVTQLSTSFGSQFDVVFFSYDWRLSNDESAQKLETVTQTYSDIVLVAHSMGGLVASRFLTRSANNRAKTKGLITIGTPFTGAAKCLNAMETGELLTITVPIVGVDVTLLKGTIKEICQNSFAAYQLLPTAKYYTMTGCTPISVGGTSYSNIAPHIYNVDWIKKSNGETKSQFSAATNFHNKLHNTSGSLVINWTGVNSYTIAGDGTDTISGVDYTSDYKIKGLKYSNSGDGTVLRGSAGYGSPDISYSSSSGSCEHTALVQNIDVINRVISQITSMTGISSAKMIAKESCDFIPRECNTRGWLTETDNRRINIYADQSAQLYLGDELINEVGERLYTSSGIKVGSVWPLGDTGRKMYALFNNCYDIQAIGDVTIEYMNSGYYDKIEEYSGGENMVRFSIGDYSSMNIEAIKSGTYSNIARDSNLIQPTHVYSETELLKLNQD